MMQELHGNVIRSKIERMEHLYFLNGYTSINNNALRKVLRKNLDDDYFFDTINIFPTLPCASRSSLYFAFLAQPQQSHVPFSSRLFLFSTQRAAGNSQTSALLSIQ